MAVPRFPASGGIALRHIAFRQLCQLFQCRRLVGKPQFLGFCGLVHNKVVVLQRPTPFLKVVCFQNLLPGFLDSQLRGVELPAVHHRIIAVVNGVVPALVGRLDGNVAFAAQLPRPHFVLRLNLRVNTGAVTLHDFRKLADMVRNKAAEVEMVVVQSFESCRIAAAIGIVNLNHAAVRDAVNIVIAVVDEPDVGRDGFRLPDTPPADACLRNVFEDLDALQLDGLAFIVRKLEQIPIPRRRNGVSAIGRKVLLGNLAAFQRLTGKAPVGGKADACTVLAQMQVFVAVDLKSEHRSIDNETVYSYLEKLEKAYLLHRCSRYDLRGKEILKTQEKFYLADTALRYSALGYTPDSVASSLENVVYLDLCRRGYTVTIGKTPDGKVDFVAQKQNDRLYVQVTQEIKSEKTEKREYERLLEIRDNYPKYVLRTDEFVGGNYQGIKSMHIADFLLSTEY